METTAFSPGVQAYMARGAQMMAAEATQRATMRGKKFDTIAVHGIYNMEAALANQGSKRVGHGFFALAFGVFGHSDIGAGGVVPQRSEIAVHGVAPVKMGVRVRNT